MRFRVRILSAGQGPAQCDGVQESYRNRAQNPFASVGPVRIACISFLPYVFSAIFKDQCVEPTVLYQDTVGWSYK